MEDDRKRIKDTLASEEQKVLKKCKSDAQCNSDQLCAFNEKDETHYCISNQLYVGCLKSKDSISRSITSIQENDVKDVKSCIDFARKLNNHEILYDYTMYQPKKEVPIQKSSIQMDLMCGDMKVLSLPYEDYMDETCDIYQEHCTLRPKEIMKKIISKNQPNCKKDYHLQLSYKCDVENREKSVKVPLINGKIKEDEVKLSCPVEDEEGKNPYQATCTAYSIHADANLEDRFDANKSQEQCGKYASYQIPNIIQDLATYQAKKKEGFQKKIQKFENMIQADEEELFKKKALQYMLQYEKKYHQKISYSKALEQVKSIFEHATNSTTSSLDSWDTTSGINKIPFEINSPVYDTLTILGSNPYHTYEEALGDATTVSQRESGDIIIYFPENDTSIPISKQGRAYITTYAYLIEQNKFFPSSWTSAPNCITLISTSTRSQNAKNAYLSTLTTESIYELESDIEESLKRLHQIHDFEKSQLDEKTNDMDKTIHLMTQRIQNSNYQSEMNRKIIRYMYYFFIFMLVMVILYTVYIFINRRNSGNHNFYST